MNKKEWIKSVLVKACHSSLVGGSAHREYMAMLGMPKNRISLGHNVVSSEHFEKEALCKPEVLPADIDENSYFLCCTRFGYKKNLPNFVRAYGQYLRTTDGRKLRLILAGDGECRDEIKKAIHEEGLEGEVIMLGAVPYAELPWLYQNCAAFVHASTVEQWGLVVNEAMAAGVPILISERCGCAQDLVIDGQNGYQFSPFDIGDMAHVLVRFSRLSDDGCRAMGLTSKQIISDWGPDRFAQGLYVAAGQATQDQTPSRNWIAQQLLNLLPTQGER